MKTVDITNLPKPVAQAIESMVNAMHIDAAMNGVEEFDRALDELFAQDSRPLSNQSLSYPRSEIYSDHD